MQVRPKGTVSVKGDSGLASFGGSKPPGLKGSTLPKQEN